MPISGESARVLFENAGYRELALTHRHAAAIDTLPAIHADPFDRVLVAQATLEGMKLLSRDAMIIRYGNAVMAV